ncbi:unnamed protein product [Lepeophtheirus salmonis]|uniref:(salmon louse) hypothetical protein n=1 Tax=Lepeophtheirus salmonis TaxID=72036 RepID=A0A7R8CVT8_LEPSM|nr:unnamed protein product [Lepeophtheirus salmonis]CAF2947558.1 unnamed protein product [Lepeophtheirus salmonis]
MLSMRRQGQNNSSRSILGATASIEIWEQWLSRIKKAGCAFELMLDKMSSPLSELVVAPTCFFTKCAQHLTWHLDSSQTSLINAVYSIRAELIFNHYFTDKSIKPLNCWLVEDHLTSKGCSLWFPQSEMVSFDKILEPTISLFFQGFLMLFVLGKSNAKFRAFTEERS